jgi:hypothetical protein
MPERSQSMFLQINNIEMPQLTSITVDEMTITDSERNDHGDMVHEFITKKKKVNAEFGILTDAERQSIYNQININNGLSLQVRVNDPVSGAPLVLNCYVGDRSIHLLRSNNGVPAYWDGFKLSLIQN